MVACEDTDQTTRVCKVNLYSFSFLIYSNHTPTHFPTLCEQAYAHALSHGTRLRNTSRQYRLSVIHSTEALRARVVVDIGGGGVVGEGVLGEALALKVI